MTKLILNIVVAFVVSLALGRVLIPVLRALKAGQSIREDGPTWHNSKAGTPTMGGLSFIGASVISSAAHGCGQILAAAVLYGVGATFYLPVLLICGIFTGAAIGAILNVLYIRTEKIINVKAK